MAVVREKRAHIWERDNLDWYVEPIECSLALFSVEKFPQPIWDPACGQGNIVQAALLKGFDAFGSDVRPRSGFKAHCLDFFRAEHVLNFRSIVCNPPFQSAEKFVVRALSLVPLSGKVGMLLPIIWLAGFSRKRAWLPYSPLTKVYVLSPRPSMPPGHVLLNGGKAGNGTRDYAWFIWQRGYLGSPTIEFLDIKKQRLAKERVGESAC